MTKRYFNEINIDEKSNHKVDYYKTIDWNQIEDAIDKATWEKLTSQFWLDTRIPVSRASLCSTFNEKTGNFRKCTS